MLSKMKFIIFLSVLLFFCMGAVSAEETNSSDIVQLNGTETVGKISENEESAQDIFGSNESAVVQKTTPTISIASNNVYSKDTLEIYLKNSSGAPLKSKKLKVTLDNKVHSVSTNSMGVAKLGINLASKTYKMTISFEGDDDLNSVSKSFYLKVSKLKTKIIQSANFVVKGKYLYFHLVDSKGNSLSSKQLKIKFNGKTYTKKTNKYGKVKIKISSSNKISVTFKADKQFKSSSKKFHVYVNKYYIKIGNSKLLTNGFLRVYFKINGKMLSKKVVLKIGSKKLSKKSSSEGIAVFKPQVKAGSYTVFAYVGKYYSAKHIRCYEGNVKDPLKESVSYNGKPDIDVMPGNYVMGDGSAKYTLKKSQYREVLKRDSHCLFLNNKLTKYTFFKTKSHPNTNHIIKREKWNVIERAINTKLVKKYKVNYWPGSVTVSLKGKSYTYPYVRDVQNTGYTCGPASCSMCSQVLKNYVSEKYIAKLAKSDRTGTSCPNMIVAMSKNNFESTYFFKSTFNDALNELKKGGCALVFHSIKHYVSILDISNDGKKVLVSNSYGTYDNIASKWIKVSYLKTRFSPKWSESLIVRLNYDLSDSTKNSVNCYYNSFGTNWQKHNTHQTFGKV